MNTDWGKLIMSLVDFFVAFKPTPEQRAANVQQRQLGREVRYLKKRPRLNTYSYIRTKYPKWDEEQIKTRVQAITDML